MRPGPSRRSARPPRGRAIASAEAPNARSWRLSGRRARRRRRGARGAITADLERGRDIERAVQHTGAGGAHQQSAGTGGGPGRQRWASARRRESRSRTGTIRVARVAVSAERNENGRSSCSISSGSTATVYSVPHRISAIARRPGSARRRSPPVSRRCGPGSAPSPSRAITVSPSRLTSALITTITAPRQTAAGARGASPAACPPGARADQRDDDRAEHQRTVEQQRRQPERQAVQPLRSACTRGVQRRRAAAVAHPQPAWVHGHREVVCPACDRQREVVAQARRWSAPPPRPAPRPTSVPVITHTGWETGVARRGHQPGAGAERSRHAPARIEQLQAARRGEVGVHAAAAGALVDQPRRDQRLAARARCRPARRGCRCPSRCRAAARGAFTP